MLFFRQLQMAQENGGVVWVVMGGTGVNGLTWHSWFLKGTHAVMCYLTILVLLTYLNGGILFFLLLLLLAKYLVTSKNIIENVRQKGHCQWVQGFWLYDCKFHHSKNLKLHLIEDFTWTVALFFFIHIHSFDDINLKLASSTPVELPLNQLWK